MTSSKILKRKQINKQIYVNKGRESLFVVRDLKFVINIFYGGWEGTGFSVQLEAICFKTRFIFYSYF